MEKYINKVKHIIESDKKTQNLIIALVCIAVLIVTFSSASNNNDYLNVKEESINTSTSNATYMQSLDIETKLAKILEEISGLSEVSVMINYDTTDKIIPVYDIKENIEQEVSDNKSSTTSVTEKSVAYQDGQNGKTPIVESTELATAKGAIVVAKGASTADNVTKIKEAIACITGIPVYKISVFEK